MDAKQIRTSGVVTRYLKTLGYRTVSASYYKTIQDWLDWYMNGVDEFHKSSFWNGIKVVDSPMKSLGMGKTVCETWANLLMNEKVAINVEDEKQNEMIENALNQNKFYMNANRLCELYFALGTGAFVEYFDNDEVKIDYVTANMIFPLTWDTTGIKECAFASKIHTKENGSCIYIQIHIKNDNDEYEIYNRMIHIEEDSFKELPLPSGLEEHVLTGSRNPRFQIVTPNIINNVDISNPLGISVYANAIDVLKGLDITFDALDTEITTGRRKVFVSSEGFYVTEDGVQHNVISDNEEVLRWMGDSEDGFNMHDFSPNFRIDELVKAMQIQLNLLSEKVGMGSNQFEFSSASRGVKTATEIVSEDSDMFTTLKKHEIVLKEALEMLIITIGEMLGFEVERNKIRIDFDDSIIEDKEAERKQDLIDLSNGILKPEEYRAKYYNETEEEAKRNLPSTSEMLD